MSCVPARCSGSHSQLAVLHVCLILASSLLFHGCWWWWCSLWPELLSWSQACCGALMQKAKTSALCHNCLGDMYKASSFLNFSLCNQRHSWLLTSSIRKPVSVGHICVMALQDWDDVWSLNYFLCMLHLELFESSGFWPLPESQFNLSDYVGVSSSSPFVMCQKSDTINVHVKLCANVPAKSYICHRDDPMRRPVLNWLSLWLFNFYFSNKN